MSANTTNMGFIEVKIDLFFFLILIFEAVLGGVQTNGPKWKIITSVTHQISGTI